MKSSQKGWLFIAAFLLALLLSAEPVRIATYNVENYLIMKRRDAAGGWTESPKPEKEKTAVREVILQARPHILCLQEMGDVKMLRELQQDLRRLGLDYPYAMMGTGIDEVRKVAVLSQLKPERWKSIDDLSFSYRGEQTSPLRGLLEVEFKDEKGSWFLYTLHLKSKYTNFADDFQSHKRRASEARVIRDYLRETHSEGDRWIVAGDFNDTADTLTLRQFFTVNKKTLMHPIPAMDESGLRWTHYYQKGDIYARIDFILASPAAYEYWIPQGAGIIQGSAAWQASDHRLVYAEFGQ